MTAETKRLITAIGCKNKQAILLGTDGDLLKPQATLEASLITVAEQINNSGADELLILDLSEMMRSMRQLLDRSRRRLA